MTTREKGTGLGLAIVQKIAEQHGGNLQLLDAPKRNGSGGGACIRLDFPDIELRETADTPAAARDAPRRKARAKPASRAKAKSGRKKPRKRKTAEQGVIHGV